MIIMETKVERTQWEYVVDVTNKAKEDGWMVREVVRSIKGLIVVYERPASVDSVRKYVPEPKP